MKPLYSKALFFVISFLMLVVHSSYLYGQQSNEQIQLRHEQGQNKLFIQIGGSDKLVYRYGPKVDLVHFYPVRSPSGASMTVQKTEPFPHHRSFWFADEVRPGSQDPVNFYGALYSKVEQGEKSGRFRHRIRHRGFDGIELTGSKLVLEADLVWEKNFDEPVLDEQRIIRVHALGNGEYLMDITFTVTAAHGEVTFVSDRTHYAWPYIRMNKTFNVKNGGGKIVNSNGGVNKSGTNFKEAQWVDYSARVDGETEGLTIFSHPDNPQPHKWLTRNYGCFGPRRIDSRSGNKFSLENGESLSRRVGVYVHRGDVKSADVEEMFDRYKSME